MKNKLDLFQMDLPEKHKTLEDAFFHNTLYNLSSKIDNLFFELSDDEKGPFLKWMELEFIANRLLYREVQLEGIHRFADPTEAYAIVNAQKQKIDYLQDWVKEKKENRIDPELGEIDFSNTTGVEKMIYLHKLGVIDFLIKKQPFNASINSLAVALSAAIGEKTSTIQSYLNPMVNKVTAQKNNPLNKEKPVAKVENQLIKIGFNLDETN
jgi:hypothetical protein